MKMISVLLTLFFSLGTTHVHAQDSSTTSSQPKYVVYGQNNEREQYTLEEMTKIAQKGNVDAQFTLGNIYRSKVI